MTKRINFILLIIIVLFASTLLIAAPVGNVASATTVSPGDGDFSMDDYREVYSTSGRLTENQSLILFSELQSDREYDVFEYVIEIRCQVNFIVGFADRAISEGYIMNVNAENFMITFEWGMYDPNGAENKREIYNADRLGSVFLRLTNEDITLCHLPATEYPENRLQYAMNNFRDLTFKKGSSEYNELLLHFNSAKAVLSLEMSSEDDYYQPGLFDNSITVHETFKLYRSLNVPELETPAKEGYTFTGWYYDEACTVPYDYEPITSDTSLYAGWEINRYNVYFNDDVVGMIHHATVDWGTSASCPVIPEQEGKTFSYWAYEDGTQYIGQPIKSDTQLFAVFDVQTYTITFETNGGNDIESISIRHGQAVSDLPTPAREGYIFLHWYAVHEEIPFEDTEIDEDITLYAAWVKARFKVTFFVDNEVYRQITVDYGTVLTDAAKLAKVDAARIRSVKFDNSTAPETDVKHVSIIDNAEIELAIDAAQSPDDNKTDNSALDKINDEAIAFFNQYGWYVLGGVVAFVVIVIAVVTVLMIRRRK